MGKRIKHMGMNLSEKEHEKWHREQHQIAPEQHEALIKQMNIGKEEDERWHKGNEVTQKESIGRERKPINPFAIGGGFLDYCVSKGWLIREGKGRNAKYFITDAGKEELKKLGIKP